jgi:hypothetical protein
MVVDHPIDLLPPFEAWLQAEPAIRSAVLFGSRARAAQTAAPADQWSDVDLHIVTRSPRKIVDTRWESVVRDSPYCLKVVRSATGGVNKLTVLFASGEADLVLVPLSRMRLGALALKLGLHRRVRIVADALNAFAMPLSYGYRFIKGESAWGPLYARIVSEMEGFRLDNDKVRQLATVSLYEQFYALQKLQRGELVAAQRVLHRSLGETNIMLLHELRVRRGELSIQQARRVEQLASPQQLSTVQISARLEKEELFSAILKAGEALKMLVGELDPDWSVTPPMQALLERIALAFTSDRQPTFVR